jgi:hypothetical protein
LGDLGDIFKPTVWNESSQEISNDNEVRVVNLATTKNVVVKNTMFPHRNIHKHASTSPEGKKRNYVGRQNMALKYTSCPVFQRA